MRMIEAKFSRRGLLRALVEHPHRVRQIANGRLQVSTRRGHLIEVDLGQGLGGALAERDRGSGTLEV